MDRKARIDIDARPIYPVKEAAALIGITDGRVYQLITEGQGKPSFLLPEDGQYLRTATHEEMLEAGVNPAVITKPRHWIPAYEIRRFKGLKRR
jgi:hypothetical protein